MTKRRTHPGDTGDSRRLALAVWRGGLDKWLAAEEARLAEFEASVERVLISKRRGLRLERALPQWAAASRDKFNRVRRTYRLLWLFGVGRKRLRALEAREAAAYARVAERVAEERAKGWPLKTLYGAGPEVG